MITGSIVTIDLPIFMTVYHRKFTASGNSRTPTTTSGTSSHNIKISLDLYPYLCCSGSADVLCNRAKTVIFVCRLSPFYSDKTKQKEIRKKNVVLALEGKSPSLVGND